MSSAATKVLIIRHGEKPGDPATDNADDSRDLSSRGFAWPGTVFDRVWSLDLPVPAGATGIQVQNIPQEMLFGDSST